MIAHIIDDDKMLRNTLRNLCTMEGINNTTYCSAEDFLHSVTQTFEPGCLILDLRMSGMSGIELQSKIREKYSHWPIIFLTGHGQVHTAVEALKKGALDFLEKPVDNDVLISKVKKALAMSENLSVRAEMESKLTDRERDVLGCLEFGLSIKETANQLGVSEKTIEFHRFNVKQKINIRRYKSCRVTQFQS